MVIVDYFFWGLLIILMGLLVWRFSSRRISIPCPSFLASLVEMENPLAREHQSSVIAAHLELRPGMKALDVGCGPGRVTIALARGIAPDGEVTALDIQPGMIERARKNAQKAGVENIRFLLAGAGDGMLQENYYDCAVLSTVLGEIPDRKKALNEIHHSLKPGGVLSVTEIIFDPHFQRPGTVRDLGAKIGFREKAFFGNRLVYTMHLEKV